MKKIVVCSVFILSCVVLQAMEEQEYFVVPSDIKVIDVSNQEKMLSVPSSKKATVEQAGKLLQLAELYSTKGSLENPDKARRLYLQSAAYRRELIRRQGH